MLKIIKKFLKMYNFNISVEMSFIYIIVKNNFDLKMKNIKRKSASIETFAVKINI